MMRAKFILLFLLAGLWLFLGCEEEISGGNIQVENCGNGEINAGEGCDDANRVSGDGCSEVCQIEEGWLCPELGVACYKQPVVSKCGNAELDAGEDCDDGNAKAGDGCNEFCKIEDGYVCDSSGFHCVLKDSCGDGIVDTEAGEACDDANRVSGDGCNEFCQVEEGYVCPAFGGSCVPVGCGNGFVDDNEDCDHGEYNTASYGQSGCGPDCKFPGKCGDAILQPEFEKCDNGEENNNGGYNECRRDCSGLATFCGDEKVTHDEQCDDGNAVSGDGCDENCKKEAGYFCPISGGACVKLRCGNGKLDADEECDDGNNDGGDGCSQFCRVEFGYKCEKVGALCEKITCGDGKVEGGEQCDDANAKSGDGCSETCRIESGWVCPNAGKACIAKQCGDGVVAGKEQCDDANKISGDGCSESCQLESGWHCPEQGKACVKAPCGDGILQGLEQCDDGNSASGDGCSSTCKIEYGYKCETPGSLCEKIVCGDKKIEGVEQCDDGNAAPGDGCDANCQLEHGWYCPVVGEACKKAVCGNGVVEGLEECDDGNDQAGDGCSPLCEIEPIFSCDDGVCKPVCGDGITMWIAGEQCDDGNLVSGDGCSADCKIEAGFECTKYGGEAPKSIKIPAIYRDFRSYEQTGQGDGYFTQALVNSLAPGCFAVGRGHPDFDRYSGHVKGLVKPVLGADGRPVLNMTGERISCEDSFNMWYRSVPGVNLIFKERLELEQDLSLDPQGRSYVFDSNEFFPLDDRGYGNYIEPPRSHNYGFTTELQAYFQYKGGEVLDFRGDDDVWVFINNRLAVDIGGVHGPINDSVALARDIHPTTGKHWDARFNIFEDGIYSIVLFHAERHYYGSIFKLTLSGFLNMGTTSCSAICGDGIIAGDEECDTGLSEQEAVKQGCSQCRKSPVCGDGIVEYPEHCDPPGGNCRSNCTYASCGNAELDAGEECDGNAGLSEGERCLSNCKKSRCGDRFVDKDAGEECDDGNENDQDLCTNACKQPYCGDNIVTPLLGEVCDDGINDGAYGGCALDCSFTPPHCGDGIVDTAHGEECDDGINDGSYFGCTPTCQFAPRCGDAKLDPEYEECDDGNLIDEDGCDRYCRKEYIVN
ncbi:MAG: DUF4215 domain-containing protein [Bradymonadales bacterium]